MTDNTPTAGTAAGPSFTRDGRRWLEARADHLRSVVVPELQLLLDGGDRSVADEHERLLHELVALDELIERSSIADDGPDDPEVVELGETVTIALEDGSFEQYRLVDPMESAVLGGSRVTADSPLGIALMGSRVGDEVEVDAPGGVYRCRVTSADRLHPPADLD